MRGHGRWSQAPSSAKHVACVCVAVSCVPRARGRPARPLDSFPPARVTAPPQRLAAADRWPGPCMRLQLLTATPLNDHQSVWVWAWFGPHRPPRRIRTFPKLPSGHLSPHTQRLHSSRPTPTYKSASPASLTPPQAASAHSQFPSSAAASPRSRPPSPLSSPVRGLGFLLARRPIFRESSFSSSVSMAASTKTVAVLLAAVLLALVASAAASRKLEEDALLGSLAPAPAPAVGGAAGLPGGKPGAWAVAALVSLVAFLVI
jgi:hypothetical protein